MNTVTEIEPKAAPRRWLFAAPAVLFVVVALFLLKGLDLDPRMVPSPLIGKPIPEFDLPALPGRKAALAETGLSSESLRGEVSLVNVFASWCVACRQEHGLLLALANEGTVALHGLNYKDQPADAKAWLDALGDPYSRVGVDLDGRAGIEWGVYGVPETFLIAPDGTIAYKHIGPVTPQDLRDVILPKVAELRGGS